MVNILIAVLLYVLLFSLAGVLDSGISMRNSTARMNGQKAFDVVVGVSLTLAVSVVVSIVMSPYPFFATAPGTYCIILVAFAVSGLRMLWGDIKRDKKEKAR